MADLKNIGVQVDLDEAHATVTFQSTPSMTSYLDPIISVMRVPVSKNPETTEDQLKAEAIAGAQQLLRSVL